MIEALKSAGGGIIALMIVGLIVWAMTVCAEYVGRRIAERQGRKIR
jgi:hypothetical protein